MTTDVAVPKTASLNELIGDELRALLARRKMRQSQLARQLGVAESWVSLRLRDIQPIDLYDLERMCEAIGVDPLEVVRSAVSGSTLRLRERITTQHRPDNRANVRTARTDQNNRVFISPISLSAPRR